MNTTRAWTTTRTIHHIAWWVFVVATLFAGGVTWLGGRRGYGPFVPDDVVYHGSYQPLNGVEMTKAYQTSLEITFTPSAPQSISLIAFIVVMIAAVIEAIPFRRFVLSIAAVAVPLIAVAVFAVATRNGTWGMDLGNTATTVVVLVGVAVHQTWMFYAGRRRNSLTQKG